MYYFRLKVDGRLLAAYTISDEDVMDVANALGMEHPDPDVIEKYGSVIIPHNTQQGRVKIFLEPVIDITDLESITNREALGAYKVEVLSYFPGSNEVKVECGCGATTFIKEEGFYPPELGNEVNVVKVYGSSQGLKIIKCHCGSRYEIYPVMHGVRVSRI